MNRHLLHGAGMVVLGLLALAVAAHAAEGASNLRVKIVNETNVVIVEFYGSDAGTKKWEDDILGSQTLPPGQSIVIDFDDGSGKCLFDFKAVFADGDVLIRKGIDVCKTSSYRYTNED